MKRMVITAVFGMSALGALAGCDEQKPAESTPAATASEKSKYAKVDSKAKDSGNSDAKTKPAAAKPEKLDKDGLEKLADSVAFTHGDEADGKFKGKIENKGTHDIGRLEYNAFAYGEDDKLIEMVKGKFPKKLAAGKSVELEVGPFPKAKGQKVTIELVVSWMNVDGTSYQRPVPKDRAKGGPNNALKK